MAHFLLIHGSCHAAWCWREVLPLLHAAGHQARAIDLPAHGADSTPAATATLDGYAIAILAAITDPVILVGHSMAGFPIAAAAEREPAKVAKLIFVCAYAPRHGLSMIDMRKQAAAQPLLEALILAPDRLTYTVDPTKAGARFYHDCPPATAADAITRLTPEPVTPQATRIHLTARYDAVEKHYIRCLDDRTIPPEHQAAMTATWPAASVTTLPTGHSPFFAAPALLAARLIALASSNPPVGR